MNLKALSTLAMGTVLLVGCTEEDYGFSGKDIAYEKEFNTQFPNVDPAHNWCTVQARELQVKTSQSSDICVYDESGTQLLAHYYNINGADRIVFDLEVNAHRVLVSDGSTVLKVGLDEVADFSVTRAATADNDPARGVIDQNAGPCPYYFFFEDLGAKADFDFNDIVLKVEYTPSNEPSTAKVSLMAAGGTLPFTVSYVPSGELDSEFSGLLFSKDDFSVEDDQPVNVNATKNGVDGKEAIVKELRVPAYFSVARHLASFVANVEDRVISATPHSTLPEDNTPRVVVFRKHDTDWSNESNGGWSCAWPQEGVNIKTVYPAFESWVANQINARWPNYMFEGDSDAVVYDTPYFYVKANTLSLKAAELTSVDGGAATISKPAEETTVEIIPKRGYLDNQTVDAYLSTMALNPSSTTSLATISGPTVNADGNYVYSIKANEIPQAGEFNLNVSLSGTDYTRPLSAALKFTVTATQTIIINNGDIVPGVDYTLQLARANQTGGQEDTNVKTDHSEFSGSVKFLVFYFDKYNFKLDGIAEADYNKFEVVLTVDGNYLFQAYSYTKPREKYWEIDKVFTPSNSIIIPMNDFYNYIVKTDFDMLLVVRAGTGNSSLPDFYHLMIREKAN